MMVTISSSCFGQIARIGTRTRQRLSRGQGRPKAMASVLASRGLSRGKRPVTDQYRKAKRGEDDPFWTKLYAKLLREFEIERCHQYPKAKAMLMMMGVIEPPEDARQTIKNLFVDESTKGKIVGGSGSFEHDELSGHVRGGIQNTMLFITDLDYTTKGTTSKRITAIALGLQNEMALQCCRTFQIEGYSHKDIINTLQRVHSFLEKARIRATVLAVQPFTFGCV